MKRRAKRLFRGELNTMEAECPFCGYIANMNNAISYCAGCGATYCKNRRGHFIFDNKRIHPMFRVQEAGGIRMG